MPRRIVFDTSAWEDYLHWQTQDRRTLDRIVLLIRECQRDPFRGIGKPEPLKGQLRGCWSRRINDANRLVYRVAADDLKVLACRFHHGDKQIFWLVQNPEPARFPSRSRQ